VLWLQTYDVVGNGGDGIGIVILRPGLAGERRIGRGYLLQQRILWGLPVDVLELTPTTTLPEVHSPL
jgi:hypothetical protein